MYHTADMRKEGSAEIQLGLGLGLGLGKKAPQRSIDQSPVILFLVTRSPEIEGAEINASLHALKECFRAMASNNSNAHVPFRSSNLTKVIMETLI